MDQESQNWNWESDGEQPAKTLYVLDKKDTAFAVCAVAVSIFGAVFGICGGFALGYCLSTVFMVVLFVAYFAKGKKLRVWPVLCGLLSLANSAVFVCTSNGSVRFFGVIISFLSAVEQRVIAKLWAYSIPPSLLWATSAFP